MTKSQQKELIVWEYFIPENCDWAPRTDEDLKMFFEWSEQGKHKDLISIPTFKPEGRTYFHALVWGKKRAGINIHELYEPGVLDGTTPYYTILGLEEGEQKVPREVMEFIAKEIFKGADKKKIHKLYDKQS